MYIAETTVREWIEKAIKKGATHLIVCRDMVNMNIFPRLVMPGKDWNDVCDDIHESQIASVWQVFALEGWTWDKEIDWIDPVAQLEEQ